MRLVIPALVLLLTSSAANAETIAGRASVVDGDTIDIHDQRLRLLDVDAPESRQPCVRPDGSEWRCGQQAALALSDWIGARPVACETTKKDRYKRWLARCSVGAIDGAKAQQLGIWSGEVLAPWEWRAQH